MPFKIDAETDEIFSLFRSAGFPYADGALLAFVGGSQLHGAKLDGTDDTDWYGVFVEPPEKVLGIDAYEHFVWSTGGKEGGNKASDIDVCLYSLRKWAALACKGNPSVLHFLFAPPRFQHMVWCMFSQDPTPFLAKSHLSSFLGYANAQAHRLYNGRGPRDVSRPFLESEFGYDTKYAMHIIRLIDEARELMQTGHIILPRPNASELVAIRRGKYKLYELEAWADELGRLAQDAQEKSPLPERTDRREISRRLAKAYRDMWDWQRKTEGLATGV